MPTYCITIVRDFAISLEADSMEEALDKAFSHSWEEWAAGRKSSILWE